MNEVKGNVLENDDYSVDGPNTVKQVMYQFDGHAYTAILVNGTVSIDTDFGHLTIDSQGNYTYTITATLPNDHVTEDRIQYQIVDNDGDTATADLLLRMAPAPLINIVPNDSELGTQDLTVTEGPDVSVQYKVVVTGVLLEDLSFTVATYDNTAFASGNVPGRPDYVATSTDIVIPADEINALHEVVLPSNAIVNDSVFEQDAETFDTTIVMTQGAIDLNSDLNIVTTIQDDDFAPYVQIVGGTVSEGGGSINVEVKLFGSSAQAITFDYATSNGTAVASGAGAGQPDYSATSGTITFNPLVAAGPNGYAQSIFIAVAINNDTTYEVPNLENFSITLTSLGSPGSLDLGSSTLSATVNIQDNDQPPTLTVSNVSVLEDAGSVNVVINRIGGTTEAITFKLSTSDITTTAGSDYTSLDPNTIYTIPASNGNSSITVTIPIVIDGFVEPNETFGVNITPVSGTLSGTTNGVVTIVNDDVAAQANNDNVTVDPALFAAYNITLILDTSGSMALSAGTSTRLDILKAALNDTGNLLDTYFALSNGLHVNIIEFNSNASFISQKDVNDLNDLDAVKNDIDDLSPAGGTNYEDALVEAIARFVIDDGNSGLNGYINRSYFISDGEPTSGNEGDTTAWQAALSLYGVHSFTANISAGTASSDYLNPIATQTNVPLTFVAANDLSNLDDFLLSTIAISGNVLSNDAAGSSGAGSVISYSYNNGANSATVGDIVTTLLGGKFVMYADGSYNYIPDGNNSTQENEIFHYNIQDPGGNQSSAILTLTMEAYVSPVVLDLNNDANIELISAANSGVGFDVNHDGVKEQIGWVSPDDGILVYDPTHSGQVTDINQIAFTSYVAGAKTDLEGLRFFDSNHDGKLDVADPAFSHFGVWQDSNTNGVVDSGEYQVLDQAGIASISLTSDHNRESVSGNMITGYTAYQTTDGQSHLAADVSLSVGSSIIEHNTNNVVNSNDVLPESNALDFASLVESNAEHPLSNSQVNLPSNPAPLQVVDAIAAAIQADASVTVALQQAQQESAVL